MKTALVFGGARGIGRAMVRKLAADGWRLAFSYHNSKEEAAGLAKETGAFPIHADLSNDEEAQALAGLAIHHLGHLDAAVFNAGVSLSGLAQDLALSDWDALFAVNLRGAFIAAQPVIRHMVGNQSGALLFISSMWGLRGAACEAAYASSKAGLIGLAQSLALELGPSGIRVNTLAPGAIETDMLNEYTADEKADLARRSLLGRLGQAEEVANAAAFLLSGRASYITGQVLSVDGGFL